MYSITETHDAIDFQYTYDDITNTRDIIFNDSYTSYKCPKAYIVVFFITVWYNLNVQLV